MIKYDFQNVLKELQHKSFLNWRSNNNFISLIPKKNQLTRLRTYTNQSCIWCLQNDFKYWKKDSNSHFLLLYLNNDLLLLRKGKCWMVLIANELITSRIRSAW